MQPFQLPRLKTTLLLNRCINKTTSAFKDGPLSGHVTIRHWQRREQSSLRKTFKLENFTPYSLLDTVKNSVFIRYYFISHYFIKAVISLNLPYVWILFYFTQKKTFLRLVFRFRCFIGTYNSLKQKLMIEESKCYLFWHSNKTKQ